MRTIRERREDRGITQAAIARYLGVTRQTYASYEQHPEKLSIDQAIILCDILDCDFDSLLPSEVNYANNLAG